MSDQRTRQTTFPSCPPRILIEVVCSPKPRSGSLSFRRPSAPVPSLAWFPHLLNNDNATYLIRLSRGTTWNAHHSTCKIESEQNLLYSISPFLLDSRRTVGAVLKGLQRMLNFLWNYTGHVRNTENYDSCSGHLKPLAAVGHWLGQVWRSTGRHPFTTTTQCSPQIGSSFFENSVQRKGWFSLQVFSHVWICQRSHGFLFYPDCQEAH